MFQALGLDSGILESKIPTLSTQKIPMQAPKICELETLASMEGELGHSFNTSVPQSAKTNKHQDIKTSLKGNAQSSLTLGVSNQHRHDILHTNIEKS